jgi:hypothetical protein
MHACMQASVATIIQMPAGSNGWLLDGYLVLDCWLSGEE